MYVYDEQTCVQIPEQQSDAAVSKAYVEDVVINRCKIRSV